MRKQIISILNRIERNPRTPAFIATAINWLRFNTDLTRRLLRDPLTKVPELRIPRMARLRYGNDAICNRHAAEALLLGVQYTIHADVPGDIAEFGCMTGRTSFVLAAAIASLRSKKTLFLFDSFQGLPPSIHSADVNSPHVRSGIWAAGTCCGTTPWALRRRCEKVLPREQIVITEGWYQGSVSTFLYLCPNTNFAMIHVDCDLYQSTMDALEPLFSAGRISPGCIIFFDDWYCNRANPDMGEQKAWIELSQRYQIYWTYRGDYTWGAASILVHTYEPNLPPIAPCRSE